MKYLLKNCTIMDKHSTYNGKRMDVLVQKGKIVQISNTIKDDKAKVISSDNLCCSPGWMDMGVHLGEPGNEQRETLDSLCNAAKHGGYTDIVVFPNAEPVIETKGQIESLKLQGAQRGINIHAIAPLSHGVKGENISEYYDLAHAGALGVGDGLAYIESNGLMLRALQYAKALSIPVIHHPNDVRLAEGNNINEGAMSTRLGMKGAPALAEELAVRRDLLLAAYAEGKLVFHAISTKAAVDAITKSKQDGVYATVPFLNLIHTDQDLADFDTNLKVDPPLRSERDIKALIKGLKSGSIHAIVSNHVPLEEELKKVEYSYATAGTIGLETCYAALNTYVVDGLDLELIVDRLSYGVREILGVQTPCISEGNTLNLTVFDPTLKWIHEVKESKSLSNNDPLLGKELEGKVLQTIVVH